MEQKGKMVPSSSVPPEILWSSLPLILKQFPVKTLLKLRCVSKVWCSIIDDPDFIRLHHKHSHTRPDGVSIVLMNKDGGDYQLYSVDPEGGPLVDLLEVPSLFVSKYYSSVYEPNYADTIQLQSVNGLVCIQNRIWNPSTRQRIEIPPRKESTTTFLDVPTYLLGFDPFSDKYKILNKQVVVSIDGGGVEKRVEYQILTIGTNEWREIDSVPNEFVPYHRNHRSCCIEGVIYSFACISDEDMILAFELTREEFRIIPLPPEVDHVDCCDFYLIEVRERLGLINGAMTTISILEDSEKIVWMTQNSIFPDFILKYYEGSKFTPIGAIHTEILLCVDDWNTQVKRFFYYDLESKRLRRVDAVPNLLDIFQYGIYYTKHVESLFRLKRFYFVLIDQS
ncbi:putative F-box protein At3g52320 [Cornus florida]|uniref:putative F-box protein At3g52320 n=1 Tax=Cornus florida TaxID=4283 RepID=UPI0028963210|nr:putative F-box protein At3g52320 [Cornus florida]